MSGWCEACPVRLETRAAAAFPRGGARLAGPIEYACGSAVSCPGGAGLVCVCCGLSGPVENRRGAAARVCLVRLRSPVAGVSRFVAVAAARFVVVAADWVCPVRWQSPVAVAGVSRFGAAQRGCVVRFGCVVRCGAARPLGSLRLRPPVCLVRLRPPVAGVSRFVAVQRGCSGAGASRSPASGFLLVDARRCRWPCPVKSRPSVGACRRLRQPQRAD